MRRRLLTLAVVACWSRGAFAGDEALVVVVESEGATPTELETLDAIRAQAGDLPVTMVRERHARFADLRAQMDWATERAASQHARGVFWVDVDASGDTLLFLLEPEGNRLLLRRIKHEKGEAREAVTEEVANVAHGIIEALAEGRHVGMTDVALPAMKPAPIAEAPKPRPRPTPMPAPRPLRFALEAGWTGETWGTRAPWVNGTTIGGRATLAEHFVVRARYTFFFPATVEDPSATIRLTRHALDLDTGYEMRIGALSFGTEIGVVLDPVLRTTVRVAPGLTTDVSALAMTFAVGVRARIAWNFLPRLGVYVDGGADVFVAQTSYSVNDTPLFEPDTLRLRVDTGLVITVF